MIIPNEAAQVVEESKAPVEPPPAPAATLSLEEKKAKVFLKSCILK